MPSPELVPLLLSDAERETWKLSTDPEFTGKVRDGVGLIPHNLVR